MDGEVQPRLVCEEKEGGGQSLGCDAVDQPASCEWSSLCPTVYSYLILILLADIARSMCAERVHRG